MSIEESNERLGESPVDEARPGGLSVIPEVRKHEAAPTSAPTAALGGGQEDEPLNLTSSSGRAADRLFSAMTTGASVFVVLLVLGTGLFLLGEAIPSLRDNAANFFTDRVWLLDAKPIRFGIPDLLWTTVLISVLAMVLAVPVAIGIALFITQYAPTRLARPLGSLVDLLAAVPSIIYGLWGITILAPRLTGVRDFLSSALGWFPLFGKTTTSAGTIFTGGLVLAIMILPIVAALSSEVFRKTPQHHVEGAYALGATRWEMIRMTVLPFGRPGVVSASMLGLGRALGETIAITLILSSLSASGKFSFSIFSGGETFASKIANNAAEFDSPAKTGAFISAGLVLFALTFVVNATARAIINRRKEFVE